MWHRRTPARVEKFVTLGHKRTPARVANSVLLHHELPSVNNASVTLQIVEIAACQ